ncbi:ATP-binding protein [Acuticoccus mangrovi]|uniref:histidine kinase n=1 Tax=Acuticoccus mangrovi TaxID=2796142 RepID=A0A934IKR1_9HYPH|nr:ATP-binding protein [Acuticoccus mangrovi]MBJ3778444.1 HAMP domain-containing protein [Acuticoccus mangrovi]
MRSFRARIIALLIIAIALVVTLATIAALSVLGAPKLSNIIDPLAQEIAALATLAERDPEGIATTKLTVRTAPIRGRPDPPLSDALTAALAELGSARTAKVSEVDPDGPLVVSVELSQGRWLITPIPRLGPPPGGGIVFVGWMALIVIGTAGVAAFAASKVTRPLKMIEAAVATVSPDGVLPHVPEAGPLELRATAHALNRLSARLKLAMESRVRLVAAAGHDLRTPMTRMRLRAEFLPEEERHKWLADLEELDQIADSAIRLVREEVTQDGAEPVRIDRIVGEIVEELTILGMPVEAPILEPAKVEARPLALKRALRNLIINAATHGHGATVRVELHGTRAVMLVTDEGPGIPEAMIGQVFEPFFRADQGRRKSMPGAGLGMAIAKEIVERFGGAIGVTNRSPHGLMQTVSFPAVDVVSEPAVRRTVTAPLVWPAHTG